MKQATVYFVKQSTVRRIIDATAGMLSFSVLRPLPLRLRRIAKHGLCVCILAVLAAAGSAAQRIDVIPPTGERVVDRADLLSPSEEQALKQKLLAYEDTTSTQIVIVTIESLDGVAPVDYATELGRSWGVGQQGQDNGVVILVSRDDREVFIAPGYGLEGAIPDAIAARIVRNTLVPSFREGNFYAGLSAASDQLIAAAAGEFEAVADRRPPGSRDGGKLPAANIFILLIIAYFVISAARRGGGGSDGGKRYRRRRGGPPIIIWGGGLGGRSGGFGGGGGGFGGGGFGGGGFGGGSFGGGGAGGGW